MPEYLSPGVYVEEVSFRSKSIEGVGTSTCALIGPARKGPVNGVPELITNFGEFERMYGGYGNLSFAEGVSTPNYLAHAVRAFFKNQGKRLYIGRTFVPKEDGGVPIPGIASCDLVSSTGTFSARNPGTGYSGSLRAYLKAKRVSGQKVLDAAKEGALLRVKVSESTPLATPAQLDGNNAPPYSLAESDTLVLTVNDTPQEITFTTKAPARVTAQVAIDPSVDIAILPDSSLTITIGPEGARLFEGTIDIPAGPISAANLISLLNTSLEAGRVGIDESNHLFVESDKRGTTAAVGVSALTELGFTAPLAQPGTGNVADISAITVDEIDEALVAADAGVRATLPPETAKIRLTTIATGATASLQAGASAGTTALGLSLDEDTGDDGATPEYYEKRGSQWIRSDDAHLVIGSPETRVFELLTMTLEIEDNDGFISLFEDVGFGEKHPQYIAKVLAQTPSSRAEELQNPYYFTKGSGKTIFDLFDALIGTGTSNTFNLSGGDDGIEPLLTTDIAGAVSYSDALTILESIDDISIIAAPGHSALQPTTFVAVQDAIIAHAEKLKYRFAILDTPSQQTLQQTRETKSRIDSKYAALYYPWVIVDNPLWRPGDNTEAREISVPPSGFMAGIYARTDVQRGVWKAPANEIVFGALRFESEINQAQQEVLNPDGINCLRSFFGRGNRVWGARTTSSDPEWKYVNVRRYFIYLEKSIDRSTQWAVFEPNGTRLWSNITDAVSSFLYNEWRKGALLGATPETAFFVRCDRSTMTQADIDNGRLICEIGVAAIKPAEFVIFRIGQKTAEAQ